MRTTRIILRSYPPDGFQFPRDSLVFPCARLVRHLRSLSRNKEFSMKPNMLSFLAIATLLTAAHAQPAPDSNRNAIMACPMAMIVNSGMLGYPIISLAYERSLSEQGLSLFIPIHAGYLEDEYEKDFALGAGAGLRKYFGHAFSGSYITGQTDYIVSDVEKKQSYYSYSTPAVEPYEYTSKTRDYLSITQISFGYKWSWAQFTLDLNGGGAFYAQDKEKYTNFIANANVGFPFGAKTFGI